MIISAPPATVLKLGYFSEKRECHLLGNYKKHRDINAHQPPEIQSSLVDDDAIRKQRERADGEKYWPFPEADPGDRVAGNLEKRRYKERDRCLHQDLPSIVALLGIGGFHDTSSALIAR